MSPCVSRGTLLVLLAHVAGQNVGDETVHTGAVIGGPGATPVSHSAQPEKAVAGLLSKGRTVVQRKAELAMSQVLYREFSSADTDRSNSLSRREFSKWVMQGPHGSGGPRSMAMDGGIPHDFDARADVSEEFKQNFDEVSAKTASFWSAFLNSIAMIIVTELGDKTFFIAAVMAMRHPRMVVYLGAISALSVMTVLSAAIGFALPNLLPRKYTHYAATALFAYFGFKLLHEAYEMYVEPPKKNEELEEAEEELGKLNKEKDLEDGKRKRATLYQMFTTGVFAQSFTLTFLAEWGDRSQVATIALASSKEPIGVTIGGVIGHAFCTGLAVVGGRLLATKISERQVALAGGILFLIFALHSVYQGPAL